MPRPGRRPRPPPPLDDRDLAAEVLYLHSLWRRGPSFPAAPAPVTAAAVPNQSGTARRRPRKRKRRRMGRGAGEPEEPLEPSPPASLDASASSASPDESTPPSPAHPAAQEEAVSDRDPVPSLSACRKANKRKRRALEYDAGPERHLAPSPATAHNGWLDGPTSSSPLKKPAPPPSPGSLAHREALRAAEEFFANNGSDDDEEDEMSETEGDEEEATEFFTGLFVTNAALRGHYERRWEEGQFACMACAGRKARRFRGCVGLVQHARAAKRYGRLGAHRALAAVVCCVLGWDIERLPNIVIDPRGTLGQALAAKEDAETEVEGSKTSGDRVANELVTSKESAGTKDVEEIGSLSFEDGPKNNVCGHETNQKEDAIKSGMEEHVGIDGEKANIEPNKGSKESSEKCANNIDNVHATGASTEEAKEHAVNIAMEEPASINGEKETVELNNGGKESSEKEVNAKVSEPEHVKTADGIGDAAVTTGP